MEKSEEMDRSEVMEKSTEEMEKSEEMDRSEERDKSEEMDRSEEIMIMDKSEVLIAARDRLVRFRQTQGIPDPPPAPVPVPSRLARCCTWLTNLKRILRKCCYYGCNLFFCIFCCICYCLYLRRKFSRSCDAEVTAYAYNYEILPNAEDKIIEVILYANDDEIRKTEEELRANHGTCLRELIVDCVRDEATRRKLLTKVDNVLNLKK